ncbi:MAG: nucleotidyltransferase family protein [Actinomycetota bacterium]|nr:nucleotidyltransferase family protein [Actinomycetota bacterium]
MGGVNEKSQTREVEPERLEHFREVLAKAIEVAEGEGILYLIGGSMASNHWGRPSAVGDVDLIVQPTDAKRLLKAFDAADFDTEEADPNWLYKAKQGDISVDIIFEMEGHMYLEEEMVDHGVITELHGTRLRLMAAEDFVISQALSAGEDTPDYWYNGLGVLAKTQLDWDYLVERASRGPRRVLSLLIFAQSNDLPVPDGAIRRLSETVYGR